MKTTILLLSIGVSTYCFSQSANTNPYIPNATKPLQPAGETQVDVLKVDKVDYQIKQLEERIAITTNETLLLEFNEKLSEMKAKRDEEVENINTIEK